MTQRTTLLFKLLLMSHLSSGLPIFTPARQQQLGRLGNQSQFQRLTATELQKQCNYSPLLLCESTDGMQTLDVVILDFLTLFPPEIFWFMPLHFIKQQYNLAQHVY